MNKTKIIFFCILAACFYGIVLDQITVRVCIEYFTVAHAPIFPATSATLLALCWGIAASAPIGICFGVILALVSESGMEPPHQFQRSIRPVFMLLAAMAVAAFVSGIVGYQFSQSSIFSLSNDLAEAVPAYKHHRFMAAWFAHGATYLIGLGGGAFVCLRVWWLRGRPFIMSVFPRSCWAAIRAVSIVSIAAFIIWLRCIN